MEINILKKTTETIEIGDQEVNKIVKKKLREMFDFDGITEHEGEKWVFNWDYSGHGSGLGDHIRKATENDKRLHNAICVIENELIKEEV